MPNHDDLASGIDPETPNVEAQTSSTARQIEAQRKSSNHIHAPWYRRIRWWGWCLIAMLAVVLGTVGTFGAQALQVKAHEERAIAIAKDTVLQGRFGDLKQQASRMQDETRQANEITHNGLWNAAASLPGFGVNIQALQGMTDVVNDAMVQTVPQYLDVASAALDGSLFQDGRIDIEPVVAQVPALEKANASLKERLADYTAIPEPNLGPIRSVFDMGRNLLDTGVTYMDLAVNELPKVPQWLGYDSKQTYAILAMTPSEMRVSGGLVGAVGTVTLDKGKIEVGDFESNGVYFNLPQATLTWDERDVYVDDGPMTLAYDVRDVANFPDTQRCAEAFRDIWNESIHKDTELDGVIMADPVFVQGLVKALGNVTLPDGRVLTGDNTAEFLMNTVYKDYAPAETDAYFGLVAKTCVQRLMEHLNVKTMASLAKDMRALARNRHLSVYSFNPDLESLVMKAGFTASIPTSETNPVVGVYLTEQNPSKMGWYIKRSTTIEPTNCGEAGPQTYHVTYTLRNTMTKEEVNALPAYITGVEPMVRGTGYEKIVFFPPAGGTLSNFQVTGNGAAPVARSMNWRLMYQTLTQVQPESTVTYSFDVTTSQLATHALKIDETPTGDAAPNVTYVKQCPVE